MSNFTYFNISLSTAQQEDDYFAGERNNIKLPDASDVFPSGNYRVVDGELFQLIDGIPPDQKYQSPKR